MKKRLMTGVLSAGLLFGTAVPGISAQKYYQSQHDYYKHKQHMKTLKRVGIGAGALYNRHKKHEGK